MVFCCVAQFSQQVNKSVFPSCTLQVRHARVLEEPACCLVILSRSKQTYDMLLFNSAGGVASSQVVRSILRACCVAR